MAANRLKYIVLSDLHLGEQGSLFTPLQEGDTTLVRALSDCLASLSKSFNESDLPVFILNGDVLGLSFSNYSNSLSIFGDFVESLVDYNRICEAVHYLPGNHDHHIWTLASEDAYLKKMRERKPNEPLPELPRVSSPHLNEGFPSAWLDAFLKHELAGKTELSLHYPNLLVKGPNSGDPDVLLHHGHFFEPTYSFFSGAMHTLYPEMEEPNTLHTLEEQNGAYVDFIFSKLGRSGTAGDYFERLMETLSSKVYLKQRVGKLAKNLAKGVDFPYLPFDWVEEILSRRLLKGIGKQVQTERYDNKQVCSKKTFSHIQEYLDHYCRNLDFQENTTLIWSHTHKPFEKLEPKNSGVLGKIVNTGGWVIPHTPMDKIGASIVLIDEHNDVQALRVFHDSVDGGTMTFDVSLAEGEVPSSFAKDIRACLYHDGGLTEPWLKFRDLLQSQIVARRNTYEGD